MERKLSESRDLESALTVKHDKSTSKIDGVHLGMFFPQRQRHEHFRRAIVALGFKLRLRLQSTESEISGLPPFFGQGDHGRFIVIQVHLRRRSPESKLRSAGATTPLQPSAGDILLASHGKILVIRRSSV